MVHPEFTVLISTSQMAILRFDSMVEAVKPMGAESTGAATITADEFLALEQKVLRAVGIIKSEREARTAAETALAAAKAEIATLQQQLAASGAVQAEVESLTRERDVVRQRVEKMLAQMDELL